MPASIGSRPNILWICTDQQRWDTLGCYGNPHVHTPNLDRLAAQGTVFTHAYSQSPVCTPSRAGFLTGRYPRTTRCRQNGQDIPADEVLVTKLLADAGYVGGLSGKLHLSACNPAASPLGERRIDDGYAVFHWSHTPLPSKIMSTEEASLRELAVWPSNEYALWLHEQGEHYRRAPHPRSRFVQTGMPADLHQTTWCAEKAITFMEANAGGPRPWFFSVNSFDPHHPFDPPAAYLQRYVDQLDALLLPRYTPGELDDKPIFQRMDHQQAYNTPGLYPFPEMTDDDHRMLRAAYYAMIDLIDAQVGRLLDALERTGQADNTLVIFMSDHGEMLGDHGIYLKGPYFYEPAVRVPLLVRGPGVTPGLRSDALVELTDLAPTLLDAADLPPSPAMQGRSLWPLLTGGVDPSHHRDDVYCEYLNAMPWHQDPQPHLTMVRTAGHKLVHAHGLDTGELYDLDADPTETDNLWDDAAAQRVKAELMLRLADRLAWTTDPGPARRGDW